MDQPRPQPDQETLERFLQEPFSGDTLDGPESLSLDLDSPRLPPGVEMPQAMASGVWGRFQICGFLGQGGMGQVFEAFDPTLQRRIALKVLRSDLASDAVRVLQEARTQAKIEHPHVVKVFETGELEGRAYLAMQLIPGHTLMEMGRPLPLDTGPRPPAQACPGRPHRWTATGPTGLPRRIAAAKPRVHDRVPLAAEGPDYHAHRETIACCRCPGGDGGCRRHRARGGGRAGGSAVGRDRL